MTSQQEDSDRRSASSSILGGARRSPTSSSSGRTASTVNVETIQKRDLQAIVSASGKIQPKRLVNISADTMGRVTNLAVEEGERVKKGQFLLQIDPRNLTSAATARPRRRSPPRGSQMEQLRVAIESAKASLEAGAGRLARQQQLWKQQLTTKEALDKAENELKMRQSDAELAPSSRSRRSGCA